MQFNRELKRNIMYITYEISKYHNCKQNALSFLIINQKNRNKC